MEDERNERGAWKDFIIYTTFYAWYMEMKGGTRELREQAKIDNTEISLDNKAVS